MAARDKLGYKLVRNQWNDYDAGSSTGCTERTVNELYTVGQSDPLHPDSPLLDYSFREIPTPYNELQQAEYTALSNYINATLASQPDCLAKGDGNGDGLVNSADIQNYRKMARKTSGSSWYDVNTDGKTNVADLQIIVRNQGLNCNLH